MDPNENPNFPLTRNSLIARVHDRDGVIRQKALEEFVVSYRPALISFLVRCKQVDPNEADDVVQDFLLNKVMNGSVLNLAGRRGRFRSLLRTCLQNHLIDILRKKAREKINRDVDLVDVDSGREQTGDPIDQIWAIAIFREALTLMKHQSEYWGLFFDRVLSRPPLSYAVVVEKYELGTPAKASNALMTAKRQFNRIIEGLIAKQSYLTDESTAEEIEREIEFLRSQLANSKLLDQVVESTEDEELRENVLPENDPAIFGERLLFIDEGADANWDKQELNSLLDHLLSQQLDRLVPGLQNDPTTVSRIFSRSMDGDPEMLGRLIQLKNQFNHDAKTGTGPLPERVNVTMTFATIAGFVLAGGRAEDVTSTRTTALIDRLQQLTSKSWIPSTIIRLCQRAVDQLSLDLATD